MKNLLFLIAIVFATQSCYISRPLKVSKTIKIISDITPEVDKTEDAKYITNYNYNDYKDAYVNELKNTLINYNLNETDKENCDFTLVITKLNISETISTETIDDSESDYNGQTYDISNCSVSAYFTLYKGNRLKEITKNHAYSTKDEKITNNRNLGDYIFGDNKDNKTYRYKGLPDDILLTLSQKAGRRTVGKITKKINKEIK